ncbi:MAG: aminoacyl-tRNA hydrolase [Pedosphaera sp.]|nr:aminoacyl-tRNA hydrolase [Pedosphaera sp.]
MDANLIVGLGNPGAEYANTRHNVGFALAERLVARWSARWESRKEFDAKLARAEFASKPVWLCQPLTYMNLSGEAVAATSRFYKILPGQMLVVLDDADLPLGELRLRPQGGSGGHRGVESIAQHLGTSEFARLKIGIGRGENPKQELAGHVLGAFDPAEKARVELVLTRAAEQCECWLQHGVAKAMNDFNGVAPVAAP